MRVVPGTFNLTAGVRIKGGFAGTVPSDSAVFQSYCTAEADLAVWRSVPLTLSVADSG